MVTRSWAVKISTAHRRLPRRRVQKGTSIDLRNDKLALQRLKEAAEKAKIELSAGTQTEVNLPFITADASGPKHLAIKLTRAKLEALVDDLIQRTVEPCKAALKDAGLKAREIDEVVLVGGMTRMPKVRRPCKTFFGKEPHKGVNPDEVVAIGAAIQAGVLQGDVKDVLLLDVTPLSLGIETLGGVFTRLIDRNTTIPTKKSQVFSTADDNQTAVTIRVFQGEREMAPTTRCWAVRPDGHSAGAARRAADRGHVRHRRQRHRQRVGQGQGDRQGTADPHPGIWWSVGRRSRQMVKDAESHAEEDKKNKEMVEAKNHGEALIHSTEKSMSEHGDKISDADKSAVTAAIDDLKTALEGDNAEEIQTKTNTLSQAAMKLGEAMYQAQSEAAAEGDAESDAGGSPEEDIVDADFEEVQDDEDDKKAS